MLKILFFWDENGRGRVFFGTGQKFSHFCHIRNKTKFKRSKKLGRTDTFRDGGGKILSMSDNKEFSRKINGSHDCFSLSLLYALD